MEQVRYFGPDVNSSVPSTFRVLAFLVFSSTFEIPAIHNSKYGNITITHVAENGSVFTISTNCLGSGTPEETLQRHWVGSLDKGSKEQSGSNFGSGGFPSSPVQHATIFTAATFLLNH